MSLLDRALKIENLRIAWGEVRENKGVAGVDHVSMKAWGRNSEERLVSLAKAVRANTYKPKKLRQRKIPKKIPGEFRTLQIPTIDDRVLQRAFLQVLQPRFERKFLDCSFGYRWKRSIKMAVERILLHRENGLRWVLDADIDEFFNNVDHALLLNFLEKDIKDRSLLPWVRQWLALGSIQPGLPVGIPLGSPLSPLWANIFLHQMDAALHAHGWNLVRYADDFVVFAESQSAAQAAHAEVGQILQRLKLVYEPAKTRIASFDDGFQFVGVHFIGGEYQYISQGKEIKVKGNKADWLFDEYGPSYG